MKSFTFVAVAVGLVLLIGGTVGAYAYDAAREDRIAAGVRVGGVALGGLEREQARVKLRDELLEPLSAPVVIRARGRSYRLTAREAKISANIEAMVAEAVERSREGNVLTRVMRGLTGGEVDADIEPEVSYSREAVGRHVDLVRSRTDRAARDAKVSFTAASLRRVSSRSGLKVDVRALRTRIEKALVRPGEERRIVRVRLLKTRPEVTTAELAKRYPTVVTVDRGAFRLRLFKRLKLVKSYPIALGKAGQETPAGLYSIQNKAVNPTWNVPTSDWAGELAGRVIPPGPDNPLKARWLGVYDGVGVHGTAERGSIGTNASRGCIRMLVEDVIELYERVPVGSRIYIA